MPEVLTPDDSVEKLKGRDLDAAVAERVMRWHEETDYDYKPPQVNWVNERGEFQAIVNCADQLEGLPLWRPSESIKAAMEVVKKMRSDKWSFACTMYEGHLPYASFYRGTAASSKNAEAETLEEAICRAALKAVGAE